LITRAAAKVEEDDLSSLTTQAVAKGEEENLFSSPRYVKQDSYAYQFGH